MAESGLVGEDVMELEHVIGYTGKAGNTLHYHPTQPNTIVYGMGAVVVIQNLQDAHQQDFLRGHDNEISAIAVSTDGGLVASGQLGSVLHKGYDAPVIVWDTQGRRDVYQLLGITQGVENLAFSADARFLAATGGSNNSFYVWDMQTGEVVASKKYLKPVTSITWTAVDTSGRRPVYTLVTATNNQVFVNVLEYQVVNMAYMMATEKCSLPASGLVRDYVVACVRVDHGQTSFISGTSVSDMCIFNIEQRVYRASVGISTGGVLSICASPDFVFCGSGDGTVKKLRGYDQRWTLEGEAQFEGRVISLSLSPDALDILVGTDAGNMYRLLIDDMSVAQLNASHINQVVDISFGARSDIFSTLSVDGQIRLWDLSDYSVICPINVDHDEGSCLVFAKSDDSVISGWKSGAIRAHSASNGALMWERANAHRGYTRAVAESANYIVSGGDDKCVRVWQRTGQDLLIQFAEHQKPVMAVSIDIGQDHLIHSAGADRSLLTYDLKRERRTVIHQLSGNTDGWFTSLAQRTDNELELVTAGTDGRILFWDCDEPAPVQNILDPNRMRLNRVAMSPSGRYVAVCGEDNQAKVYDIRSESLVAVGIGHSNNVLSLQWSPDERQIVSVGSDCCICVWNFYGTDMSNEISQQQLENSGMGMKK